MTRDTPQKPRTVRTALTAMVITIVVLGALVAGVAVLWSSFGDAVLKRFGLADLDYPGPGTGEAVVTIYEGDLGSDIATTLAEADVVKTYDAMYELLVSRPEVALSPGSYSLKLQMSAEGALEALLDPANRLQRTVVLREGLTVEQSYERLASVTGIRVEEFTEAAKDIAAFGLPDGVTSLEGWLFPATYEFEHDHEAHDILQTLVNTQRQVLTNAGVAEGDMQRVLTTASIIEREAGIAADFGKVSMVIANRLDIDMRLQMDSTAQYGVGEHADGEVWSSREALEDDNPWNTYVQTGLPIGPIANPGKAAIDAALHPEPGDWIYFVVAPGGTGASTFTSTLAEHEAAVAEYREWCSNTPDSGC